MSVIIPVCQPPTRCGLWHVADSQARVVLAFGDVTDSMERVLHTPVAAHECEQARRRGVDGWKGSDQIDDLLISLIGAAQGDSAGEVGHLVNVLPGEREVVVEQGNSFDWLDWLFFLSYLLLESPLFLFTRRIHKP
jgi:hypothetical protein